MLAHDKTTREFEGSSGPQNPGPSLPLLDGADYADSWKAFRANTDQRDRMVEWFAGNLQRICPDTYSLQVLSVGPGNGSLDLKLIPHLLGSYDHVRYSVCEPNGKLLREFTQATRSFAGPNYQIDSHQVAFGEYIAIAQFHLVIFAHSLYYMDQSAALTRAAAMITDNGKILAFNSTAKGMAQLRNELTPLLSGRPYDYFTAERLREIQMGIGLIPEIEIIPSSITVTKAFDETDQEGRALLSFLVNCDLRNATPDQLFLVRERLRSLAVVRGNDLVIDQPVAAVWG